MDDVALAVRIAGSLGFDALRADRLIGGNENHAVRVRATGDDVVVRFARDPGRSGDPFDVEAWCLRAAARAGLRTSQLVAHGSLSGRSYLVANYVPGSPASAEDLRGWRATGEFASAVRRIRTHDAPDALFSRFGRDLDRAWEEHLAYNLASIEPGDPLISLGIYPGSRRGELRDVLESLRARKLPQGLIHGDAAHRNLLRDGDVFTVIDWGAASTGPVMWGDLERLFRWHVQGSEESPVSAAAWEHVLDGAGVSRTEAEPIVRELAALHALDLPRWALDRRPDRLAEIVRDSREVLATMVLDPTGCSA